MPIQIVSPLPNQPIGIGMQVEVALDVALFVQGDKVTFEILDDVEIGRIIAYGHLQDVHSPGPHVFTVGAAGTATALFWQAYPQWAHAAHSSTIDVRVQHRRPDETVVDQLVQSNIYDTLTGLQVALPKLMQSTVQGGFTPQDRIVLQSINVATLVPIVNAVGQLVELPLSALGWRAPKEFMLRSAAFLLSGTGVLQRPAGSTRLDAHGIIWQFEVVPDGFGFVFGQVAEFYNRMVQFVVVRHDGADVAYVSDVFDETSAGHFLQWETPFPSQLQYAIAPGVTLRCWWLDFVKSSSPPLGTREDSS